MDETLIEVGCTSVWSPRPCDYPASTTHGAARPQRLSGSGAATLIRACGFENIKGVAQIARIRVIGLGERGGFERCSAHRLMGGGFERAACQMLTTRMIPCGSSMMK